MKYSHFVRNLKQKLSKIDLHTAFKITFLSMMVVIAITVICFFKNLANHRFLMCVFNIVTFAVISYHTTLIYRAIQKKQYDKKLLIKLCIDFSSLVAYLLCPLYIIMAVMHNQIDFIFPIGLCAMMLHFLVLPTARSWIKKV